MEKSGKEKRKRAVSFFSFNKQNKKKRTVPNSSVAGTITDEFYESATDQIFDNGVFGFPNESDQTNTLVNKIQKHGRSGQVRLNLFPPRMKML